MKEHELIAELSRILGSSSGGLPVPGLRMGIGDDCALITPSPGSDLLVTTDSQREGVHFRWEWIDPFSVGRRLVAVNVSDIVSKGGRPSFAFVAAGLPPGPFLKHLQEIYRGIAEESRRYGVVVAGGDLSKDLAGISLVMTLLGWILPDTFVGRGGLGPGDCLYLVGRPGRARSGLLSLEKGQEEALFSAARAAFRTPRALFREGPLLASFSGIVAMTDTSDGLGRSLWELARASRVTIKVEEVPVLAEVRQWAEALGEDPREMVWTGGEDYDLLVGVSSSVEEAFLKWARTELLDGSPEGLFRIGQVQKQGDPEILFGPGIGEKGWGAGFEHTGS
ncbi:MAG: thiamine-phosphate kinase [Leptospirillia bacterium]